jgi:hypothetical protein
LVCSFTVKFNSSTFSTQILFISPDILLSLFTLFYLSFVLGCTRFSDEKVLVQTSAKRPNVLERGAFRVHYECNSSTLGQFVLAFSSGIAVYEHIFMWNSLSRSVITSSPEAEVNWATTWSTELLYKPVEIYQRGQS